MAREYQYLSQEDIDHFMKFGYVRISGAFTPEQCANFTKDVWVRLGVDPNDVSTWNREKVNMPSHDRVLAKDFAPKAWGAMCELLGGEDRVDDSNGYWNDSFIVNMGKEEYRTLTLDPKKLDNWHVDGDFFVHFLDSPEQGLLVIPLFTDIEPNAGGTVICPDGIGKVANLLADHPEGILPRMQLRDEPEPKPPAHPLQRAIDLIQTCDVFHEMTGKVGDVILMHPLMLHSASKNILRKQRIITNPPVSLKEPFNFNRANEDEYSVVELKTISELGKDKANAWRRTRDREAIIPERLKVQNKLMEEELKRLAEAKGRASPAATESRTAAVAVS